MLFVPASTPLGSLEAPRIRTVSPNFRPLPGRCCALPLNRLHASFATNTQPVLKAAAMPLATLSASPTAQHVLAFAPGDMYAQLALALALAAMTLLAALGPPPVEGGSFVVEPAEGVKRRKTPILCVHGMAHGGWVFRAVAEKLAAEGWTVHCITMRKGRFKTMSTYMAEIQEYVEKNLDEPFVILGHSLGGKLIQQYLLNYDMDQSASKRAAGAVFVATYGYHTLGLALRSVLSIVKKNPLGCLWGTVRLNGRFVIGINDKETQRFMFRPGTTTTNIAGEGEESLEKYVERLTPVESGVITGGWLWVVGTQAHRTSPSALKLPTLSVIPSDDALIPEWTQREVAAFWGSETLCVQEQGHCLGDPGWEISYAKPFAAWLDQNFA